MAGVWHLLGPFRPDGTRCRSSSGPPQLTAQGAPLEMDVRKRLPGGVLNDEARISVLVERPRRPEAARGKRRNAPIRKLGAI